MTRDRGQPTAPARAHRGLPVALVVVLVLFTTGVWTRPEGTAWAVAYDLVLYNAVYVLAAAWAWRAVRRTGGCAAGRWLAVGLVLNGAGNAVYTLVIVPQEQPPVPSASDVLYLAFYPLVYVALVRLVRSRAPRFHARMWLDGLIGASGAAGVAIAVLLAPALAGVGGSAAEYATNLAYPAADVLLLALLVGAGGALGLRSDRALLTLGAGLALHLLGDVVYLNLEAVDRYVEGGALDLTWLVGVALMALGVQPHRAPARPARVAVARDLVEWRVLAVPVACSVASVALLAAGWGDRLPVSVACCAVACLVAVVVRTAVTFREMRRLRDVGREARTDPLTGLPNRRALLERAEDVLAAATPDRPMALLLLDLDNFKEVNDGFGHGAGDELLRQIGTRMQAPLRPADTLARLGGDEFAVVLPDTGADAALRVARRLRDALDDPFTVDGVRLRAAGSVGIATGPLPAGTVDELLRCADVAMYLAKDTDDGVQVHLGGGADGHDGRRRAREDLKAALAAGDLTVHLQPQMSLADGRTVGVEALVRWEHPSRGVLEPRDLVPVAERAGLHGPLAEAVLDLALGSAARWWSHRAPLPVAVNLAAANITDLDLPAKVSAALVRHGLPSRALTLEVVEEVAGGTGRARAVLDELRALGVAVSVDDYGTGHSPLTALRWLPADELKLDPALVADVVTDARAASVVRHTVALAHDLGLRVVAEGVEDTATLGSLAALGCDIAQGFEVAPAMPVDDFVHWLRTRPADRAAAHAGVPEPRGPHSDPPALALATSETASPTGLDDGGPTG